MPPLQDTPDEIDDTVKPYRYAWFLWSYEVFALLVILAATFLDIHRAKVLILSLISIANALLINGPIET
jgi:hypothetical protein